MNDTFRLGRIAGIPIGLNWTWLVVFAIFVWSLAAGVFPSTNPGLATATYVGMGIAAVALFFGSLLLHELGHALQARREGVQIDGITLWLFGGVARFRGMFPSAGAEFRIAIAGPLVTAVLGLAFVGLAAVSHVSSALDGVLAWLGYINLFLLAFNLLPAIPLDGGRIFRAALWRAKGDFAWATRVAVAFGRGFGAVLIGLGIVSLLVQGTFGGLWLALIGWFLLGAAGAEARFMMVRSALDGLTVSDRMTRGPLTADPDETLGTFMRDAAGTSRAPGYPVVDDGLPVGLLALGSVDETPSEERDSVLVRARMVPLSAVPTLTPDEPALDAVLARRGWQRGRARPRRPHPGRRHLPLRCRGRNQGRARALAEPPGMGPDAVAERPRPRAAAAPRPRTAGPRLDPRRGVAKDRFDNVPDRPWG